MRFDLAAIATNPQHRGARQHLATVRERLEPHVEALVEAGREAFGREDLHTALDHWRRALLIDPENDRAREYAQRAETMLSNLERLRSEPAVGSDSP